MNASTKQLLLYCAIAASTVLTACGGGSGNEPPAPTPELNINSSNLVAAAGIAGASLEQSVLLAAVGGLSKSPLLAQAAAGSIACPGGGSINLTLEDKKRTFTAVNCQTDQFTWVSGQLTEVTAPAGSGLDTNYEVKDSSLITAGGDNTAISLNGNFYTDDKPTNTNMVISGSGSVTRGNRTDKFTVMTKKDGNHIARLSTPRLKEQIRIVLDPKTKSLSATSETDGSWLKITETADGNSLTLELRVRGQDSVALTKTLSLAEWIALIAQSK